MRLLIDQTRPGGTETTLWLDELELKVLQSNQFGSIPAVFLDRESGQYREPPEIDKALLWDGQLALVTVKDRGFTGSEAVFWREWPGEPWAFDGIHLRGPGGKPDWGRDPDVEEHFFRDGTVVLNPEATSLKPEREWEAHGLACRVHWRRPLGFRCGYVRIPEGHPLYRQHWTMENSPTERLAVHGGVNHSGELDGADGWWVGFDCAHAFDGFEPEGPPSLRRLRETILGFGDHHWTLEEVVAETERLAEQVAAMALPVEAAS